jgi:uncharacterized protein with GYD domain
MAAFFPMTRPFPTVAAVCFRRRRTNMATYVVLASFTDQGIRTVKESPGRYETFKTMVEKHGVTLKSTHYTVGAFDFVSVVEGTDEAVTAALLKLGSLGNVRTQTMRAFSVGEMRAILEQMP